MPQTPAQIRAQKSYRERHHDRILSMARLRYRANPEKHKAHSRHWRKRNPEKVKAQHRNWVSAHRSRKAEIDRKSNKKRRLKILQTKRRYYHKNRSKIREYFKRYLPAYRAKLRQENPVFMLVERMRSRIRAVLARVPVVKSKKTMEYLGCTPDELRNHIKSLFLPNMSWANRHLWEVDHKKALANFDLTDPVQQAKAFHYTNLQPLWMTDNRRKWIF